MGSGGGNRGSYVDAGRSASVGSGALKSLETASWICTETCTTSASLLSSVMKAPPGRGGLRGAEGAGAKSDVKNACVRGETAELGAMLVVVGDAKNCLVSGRNVWIWIVGALRLCSAVTDAEVASLADLTEGVLGCEIETCSFSPASVGRVSTKAGRVAGVGVDDVSSSCCMAWYIASANRRKRA